MTRLPLASFDGGEITSRQAPLTDAQLDQLSADAEYLQSLGKKICLWPRELLPLLKEVCAHRRKGTAA